MFVKGKSGNPGGRPKENAEVKALARKHCEAAIRLLAKLMKSRDQKVQLAAAQAMLDRGLGKPATVIVGDEDEPPVRLEGRIKLVKPGD